MTSFVDTKNNVFEKPENKYKPGELSIKPDKNVPKLKKPIELEKKNKEIKQKEKEEKNKLNKAKEKNKIMEKYRLLEKKTTTDKEKEEKKSKTDKAVNKKLKKLFIKILRNEKKMSKKYKRDSIVLLKQTGMLNPENLQILEDTYPNIKYMVDLDTMDDEEDDDEDDDDEIKKEEEEEEDNIGVRIHKNIKDSVWEQQLKDRIELLKNASDIPEKYHYLISILQINIPKFYKYEKLFEAIKELAAELHHNDAREEKPMSDDYKRDAIVVFIIRYLANHNIQFKEFKNNLKSYFNFVKNNINIHTNEKNKLHHFGIFIIMYETFIKNNFWMMFPTENRHFFTYIIERLFQTIDEGKDIVVKNYTTDKENEEKIDPYNRIDNDNEKNKFEKINFLKIIQKKTDEHPFVYYRHLRNIWEFDKKGVTKNDKRLCIYAAARKGIIQFILLTTLSALQKPKLQQLTFYEYDKNTGSQSSTLINYLTSNLAIISYFLNTQIDIITKDSNISNSDKQDKFFKYLWKEYEMLLDL
jgi:hypothetical protein